MLPPPRPLSGGPKYSLPHSSHAGGGQESLLLPPCRFWSYSVSLVLEPAPGKYRTLLASGVAVNRLGMLDRFGAPGFLEAHCNRLYCRSLLFSCRYFSYGRLHSLWAMLAKSRSEENTKFQRSFTNAQLAASLAFYHNLFAAHQIQSLYLSVCLERGCEGTSLHCA